MAQLKNPSSLDLNDYLRLLQITLENPKALSDLELRGITLGVPTTLRFRRCGGNLPSAFSTYCFWGASTINVEHPVGEALCRAFSAYARARLRNMLLPTDLARLEHFLSSLPIRTFAQTEHQLLQNSLQKMDEHFSELKTAIESCAALNLPYFPLLKLTPNDFLPGAFTFGEGDEFMSFSLEGDFFGSKQFFENIADDDFGETLNCESQWTSI